MKPRQRLILGLTAGVYAIFDIYAKRHSNQRFERTVKRLRQGVAGAFEDYAPASPIERRQSAAQAHR